MEADIQVEDKIILNETMIIGTSPGFEVAIYTLCFFVRPNQPCKISLGHFNVTVTVHKTHYDGKKLIHSVDLSF